MITTMRTPRRGEIFYIDKNPYRPTYGSVQDTGRPAIIVSNNQNNAHALTYEIVYLTTQPKKDLPTHCTIHSSKYTSTALCEQITTVSSEQIRDFCGTCTEEEMRMVDACLAISLGLDFGNEAPAEDYEEDDTEGYDEEIEDTEYTITDKEIDQLRTDLIRAEKEAEVYRTMYESLLAKMLK